MPISKFDGIDYDKLGGRQQNELREQFRHHEMRLIAGDIDALNDIVIPENSYRRVAQKIKSLMIAVFPSDPSTALIYLEILYFLFGKQIRIDVAKRLNIQI